MPVFFWTVGLWKTPLNACLRIFRDAENEVLPENSASTEDLLSLSDSFSPWKADAKEAARLSLDTTQVPTDDTSLQTHRRPAPAEQETNDTRLTSTRAVVSNSEARSTTLSPPRQATRLSAAHLHHIVSFHPTQSPLSLTYAASHPLNRLVAEQSRGLCFPHGTTHLEFRQEPVFDAPAAAPGVFEPLVDATAPTHTRAPQRHLTRRVQASSLAGLAQYVPVAEWWWGRPLRGTQHTALDGGAAKTVPLVLVGRRRRLKPERGAPPPEINRNRIVAPSTSRPSTASLSASTTAGNAELAIFERAFGTWGSRGSRFHRTDDSSAYPVEQLTIEGFPIDDTLSLTRVPAFLHVRVLSLKGCAHVSQVGAFGRLPHLQELDLSLSGVSRLDGLERSTSLREIKASSCVQLQSLAPLGAVTSLRVIVASQSAVYDVSGLAQSQSLVSVKLYGCLELTDVSALGAIPTLQELAASESNVVVLDGIAQSRSLVLIGLRYCDIKDLAPLASLTTLEVLNISCTPVRSVEPLKGCTRLRQLAVSECAQLQSLSPLGTLPLLEAVDASNSAVMDVTGLCTAPRLARLNLRNCWRLGAVGALGRSPNLRTLHLTSSGVSGVRGLEESRSLQVVDLSYCKHLMEADVSSIQALRPLDLLNVRECTAFMHYVDHHEESLKLLKERHRAVIH